MTRMEVFVFLVSELEKNATNLAKMLCKQYKPIKSVSLANAVESF